jgi:hypothetical protein
LSSFEAVAAAFFPVGTASLPIEQMFLLVNHPQT